MDKNDIKNKILTEDDYIRSPKFSNSLNKFTAKNPEGVKEEAIAKLLLLTEREVHEIYEETIEILRSRMNKK